MDQGDESHARSAFKVVDNDDPIDMDAVEVLKAFLLDPLPEEVGRKIDVLSERRQAREKLRAV